jgi:hypothetical protein
MTVEEIMTRTARLPLSLDELETGRKLADAANPAPWKMGGEFGENWEVADFGVFEGPDGYARQMRVQTDGCNASRLCGTAEDDAALVVWMRNNIRALLAQARMAYLAAAVGDGAVIIA